MYLEEVDGVISIMKCVIYFVINTASMEYQGLTLHFLSHPAMTVVVDFIERGSTFRLPLSVSHFRAHITVQSRIQTSYFGLESH